MTAHHMQLKERDNMQFLYGLLPHHTLMILTNSDTPSGKADCIYDLRNKIVHFQRTESEVESLSDSDWNRIIQFVLETIPVLYGIFSGHMIELPDL